MARKKLAGSGYVLLLLLAGAALLLACIHNHQAVSAVSLKVSFQGDYRIGDGQWQPIVKGQHIPAAKGDITLRGLFQTEFSDGEVSGSVAEGDTIALYLNHIRAEIYRNGELEYTFDAEDPQLGTDACGKHWVLYPQSGMKSDELEIILKNPHRFGNAVAVDEFLRSMYVYTGDLFQTERLNEGSSMRRIGFAVMAVSLVLIGAAVLSSVLRLAPSGMMWQIGITVFFAGGSYVMGAPNVSVWNELTAFNTSSLLLCNMLYLFFLQCLVCNCLAKPFLKAGMFLIILSGSITSFVFLISMVGSIKLYDLLPVWTVCQCVFSAIWLVLCILSFRHGGKEKQALLIAISLALAAFLTDAFATAAGFWQGGRISQWVFVLLLAVALTVVLHIVPKSIRTGTKEKEMQAELERSRTAIMLSQIQPHFLYNSLGAIRELCRQNPEEAREAITDFITYLRSNMDSLRSEHPIHFSKELFHVETYLKLEQLRFGSDLKVLYDIQESDFCIPALTVQPLVENAVRHGICGGGTVILHSRREDSRVIVTVTDDGAGFDTGVAHDQSHVGIQSVRNRLKYMAGGTLRLESTPGKGTVATIILNIQ